MKSFFSIKSSRGSRLLRHNDVTVYLVIGLSNNTISLHITAIQDEFYYDKANNQGYFRLTLSY